MVWVRAVQTEVEETAKVVKAPKYYGNITSVDMSCFGCGKTIPAGAKVNSVSRPRCFDCGGEFLPKDYRDLQEENSFSVDGAIPYGKIGLKCDACGKPSLSLLASGELLCCNDSCSSNLPGCQSNPQVNAAAPQNS